MLVPQFNSPSHLWHMNQSLKKCAVDVQLRDSELETWKPLQHTQLQRLHPCLKNSQVETCVGTTETQNNRNNSWTCEGFHVTTSCSQISKLQDTWARCKGNRPKGWKFWTPWPSLAQKNWNANVVFKGHFPVIATLEDIEAYINWFSHSCSPERFGWRFHSKDLNQPKTCPKIAALSPLHHLSIQQTGHQACSTGSQTVTSNQ